MNEINKQECIIIDLDGTLVKSDIQVTLPSTSSREEWDVFHKINHMYEHKFLHDICFVKDLLFYYINENPFAEVIFITAREDVDSIKYNTINTICDLFEEILGDEFILFMRSKNDFRPSYIVKEDILLNMVLPRYTPIFAIDDEQANIDMFTKHGIPTLKVGA